MVAVQKKGGIHYSLSIYSKELEMRKAAVLKRQLSKVSLCNCQDSGHQKLINLVEPETLHGYHKLKITAVSF